MTIATTCQCGKKYQVKEELAGNRVKCPACGESFEVPLPRDDPLASSSDPLGFDSGKRTEAEPRKRNRGAKQFSIADVSLKTKVALVIAPVVVIIAAFSIATVQEMRYAREEHGTARPGAVKPDSLTNSIGMKFKLILPGEFQTGFPETYSKRSAEVYPLRRMRITEPFYLGVTEVTQEQFEKIMGVNPSEHSSSNEYFKYTLKDIDTSNHPVEKVSWDDAVKFCSRLSAKEGVTYRLPTEAEWEYAARAGSTTLLYSGDDDSQLDEYAWFYRNSNLQTHPVGTKKPNAWGLYDMSGNVNEWCSDQASSSYGTRVNRGGSFASYSSECVLSGPNPCSPSRRREDLGFRVVRDATIE